VTKMVVFVAIGCAVLAAACGSSHRSASPTTAVTTTAGSAASTSGTPTTLPVVSTTPAAPTSSTAPAAPAVTPASSVGDGARYLAVVNPLTDALESASVSPTPAQLDQYAGEMRSAQSQLSALRWSGPAEADIRTLVSEMGPLAADLARGDAGAVRSAADALTSASVTIRSDLGLPRTSR
jgi:hypothetical protein